MICGMNARTYARACCACNRKVTTDTMILKSSVLTHNCRRILHGQPGHLQYNMITVVPRLSGQSSSTPVAPRYRFVRGRRDRAPFYYPEKKGALINSLFA